MQQIHDFWGQRKGGTSQQNLKNWKIVLEEGSGGVQECKACCGLFLSQKTVVYVTYKLEPQV